MPRRVCNPASLLFLSGLFLPGLFLAVHAQETLGGLAKQRGIYMGAAVSEAFWGGDARYKQTLAREYNIIVPENSLKFDQLEPTRGRFNWKQGDDLAAFAAQNGMALRGHNLVWHQASSWIASAAPGLGRAEMLGILKNHIDSAVGHFQGRILEWDVANEAIDDGAGTLRDTFWRQRIGDDYLDSAYTWAHRADPKALLFYNDYSGEGMGGKADKIYALVKGMKDRGIPIHGVGLQCHFAAAQSFATDDIDRNMKRLAALGLRVSVTELDFRIALPADSAKLAVQKGNYSKLLGVCLANANCESFLTWGFTDAYSWIPDFFAGSGAALPFDADYQPKPAYGGLKEALKTGTPIRTVSRGEIRGNINVTSGSGHGSPEFFRAGREYGVPGETWNALGKRTGILPAAQAAP